MTWSSVLNECDFIVVVSLTQLRIRKFRHVRKTPFQRVDSFLWRNSMSTYQYCIYTINACINAWYKTMFILLRVVLSHSWGAYRLLCDKQSLAHCISYNCLASYENRSIKSDVKVHVTINRLCIPEAFRLSYPIFGYCFVFTTIQLLAHGAEIHRTSNDFGVSRSHHICDRVAKKPVDVFPETKK